MKICLAFALAALAISFTVPTFAQQTNPSEQNTVDPEMRQQIEAAYMKFCDAHKRHDVAAIVALYTPCALQLWEWESADAVSGQEAIEKRYVAAFASTPREFAGKLVQLCPIGNEMSAISEWTVGPWKGYKAMIYVREADTWKIRLEYANIDHSR